MPTYPYLVTFVCWGNICRSPAARFVMQDRVDKAGLHDKVVVDSSGTGDWELGMAAYSKTIEEGNRRGYGDPTHRAKQFQSSDFEVFDLIVALDEDRADDLRVWARSDEHRAKIRLLREFDPSAEDLSIGDPMGLSDRVFAEMYDKIERACDGLLLYIQEQLDG